VLEYSACRRTSTAVTRISTAKAARYALRRQRIQQELIHLALRDDLTGLYNRRAFRLLASQSLRLAYRTKRQLLMFYADLDGMKQINDRFGHAIGDRALTRVAACLRKTFRRKTDITVRMGGDEFVALAVAEKGRGPEHLAQQIQENLAEYGNKDLPCTLSLSVGFARFDPEHAQSLTDLVAHADQSLYRQKRAVPIAAAATALPVGRLPASRAANAMG
jgi:diguanylate cyclase (GGDEF)-like protein